MDIGMGRMNEDYEIVHVGWEFGNWNEEGDILLQAESAFNLAIANTWFQKERSTLSLIKTVITLRKFTHILYERVN